MLLVVLGDPLLKEGLLYRELARLITHQKDGGGFLNAMTQKKYNRTLKVCILL